ncbi:hypothetical protein, partial [Phascolarctobacterium sp.]
TISSDALDKYLKSLEVDNSNDIYNDICQDNLSEATLKHLKELIYWFKQISPQYVSEAYLLKIIEYSNCLASDCYSAGYEKAIEELQHK